jgi:hypothetical protein
MSYTAQAALAYDGEFLNRVTACASVEVPHSHQPVQWARDHIWWVSAAPGFADAYEYALLNENPEPGKDPSVITDAQILATVQALLVPEKPIVEQQ